MLGVMNFRTFLSVDMNIIIIYIKKTNDLVTHKIYRNYYCYLCCAHLVISWLSLFMIAPPLGSWESICTMTWLYTYVWAPWQTIFWRPMLLDIFILLHLKCIFFFNFIREFLGYKGASAAAELFFIHNEEFSFKNLESNKDCTKLRKSILKVNILTAHSLTLFCQSSELCRNPTIADLSTLENTSICWAAVDMLVISPWKPASEINWESDKGFK